MDRGAWWATVHLLAKSQTQTEWVSTAKPLTVGSGITFFLLFLSMTLPSIIFLAFLLFFSPLPLGSFCFHASFILPLPPYICNIQKEASQWTYGCFGQGWGAGIVREFGMDMSTLLCLKWVTNKGILWATGNSAPCYVAAWMGAGFGGEWRHAYVWLSPFPVDLKLSQHRLYSITK